MCVCVCVSEAGETERVRQAGDRAGRESGEDVERIVEGGRASE